MVGPTGVALGADGTLYVADTQGNRIAAVPDALGRGAPIGGGGITVADGGYLNNPLGLTLAPNGDILTANANDGNIVETTPGGAEFQPLDTGAGGGGLFGLRRDADAARALYFVNDAENTLGRPALSARSGGTPVGGPPPAAAAPRRLTRAGASRRAAPAASTSVRSEPMSIVVTEDRGPVRHVVLNRPEKRNAMNQELLRALGEALRAAAADVDVHCVVLRGEGPVFSAGVDLGELAESAGSAGLLRPFRQVFLDCANLCEEMAKPVVCQIHRTCVGGALEVALGCDLRISASDAPVRAAGGARSGSSPTSAARRGCRRSSGSAARRS